MKEKKKRTEKMVNNYSDKNSGVMKCLTFLHFLFTIKEECLLECCPDPKD